MDKPEDVLYLKHFVKQHPDNKMGWYLLGKHYLAAGKEGKANYCFIQAGDVYEAFEQESHPLSMSEQHLAELKSWEKRQKKKRLAGKIALIAAPLLLLALLVPANGYIGPRGTDGDQAKPAVVVPVPDARPELGVLFVPLREPQPVARAVHEFVAAGGEAPKESLAVRLAEKDGWRYFNGNTRFLLAAGKGVGGGSMDLTMLDRDTCICEPKDASVFAQRFREWKERQELHWTLSSAITHYKRLYGKWPGSLSDMIRPYPHNVLAGERETMKDIFPLVLRKLIELETSVGESGQTAANDGSGRNGISSRRTPGVGTNGLFQDNWSKPLEIIVDTSNHTLAVVQNDLIVRSYRVGLGGEKTPEGNFYISEKVRDPNGGDGIFGSRGMTLSNTLYAIHGTNEPDSIGKDESLGCIRMGDEDVKELYDLVPIGTAVKIKNGTLPSDARTPEKRFRLTPLQNETNPAKVYKWLK